MIGRIPDVNEAEELIIEFDDVYYTSTPRKYHLVSERAWVLKVDNDAFLKSLATRVKFDLLLWKVYEEGSVGAIPKMFDYLNNGWELPFKMASTKPKGEVQVTPKTKVSLIVVEFTR